MTPGRRVAHGAGEVLITLGALVLLFVLWQFWWTDVTAMHQEVAAVATLERDFARAPAPLPMGPPSTGLVAPVSPHPVRPGQAFGVLRVPRFGAGYARPILEGTDAGMLDEGVGHYPGTAMPGQVGNFAVAGHRTTYGAPFSEIDRLRAGDLVVVETASGYFVYRVERHVILTPDRVDVLAAVPQHPGEVATTATLTMTSCHPRFSAQLRYVVFGRLVRAVPRAAGLTAALEAAPTVGAAGKAG